MFFCINDLMNGMVMSCCKDAEKSIGNQQYAIDRDA
jgi:hypothetical protein